MRYISALLAGAFATLGAAQAPTQVGGFNLGPTNLKMYIYKPSNLKANAPIIVAIHHCQGSATGYAQETNYQTFAQQYGFMVIYPNSKSSGGCFDVASQATLTHNGGGDSETIANMVKYAVSNYGGDATRVFATGSSSGAMMANVLAGAYPDVFKAISAYSGVPDGCFAVSGSTATEDPPGWNNQCANGQVSKTAQQWGDLVRSYYPSYTGARPRMAIWHGTADQTLHYPNYQQMLLEWSNVLGLTSSVQASNQPQSGYTRTIYGNGTEYTAELVGYSAAGVGHTVPVHESNDIAFFGIASS